jgi:hypothetical protein
MRLHARQLCVRIVYCVAKQFSNLVAPSQFGSHKERIRCMMHLLQVAGQPYWFYFSAHAMPGLPVLPAPLTLSSLVEQPDLKARYHAMLSSPQLNAIFRLNARHVSRTIIARSLPDKLTSPVLIHVLLRRGLVTSVVSRASIMKQLRNVVDDLIAAATTDPWSKDLFGPSFIPLRKQFASTILLSPLFVPSQDTLVLSNLESWPTLRYRRPYSLIYQYPYSVRMKTHLPSSNPSWYE